MTLKRRHLGFIAGFFVLLFGGAAWAGFELKEVAPGVYVHQGQVGDFAPENRGDLANLGVVVGSHCIAVVDTGGSYAVGHDLREAIRHLSSLPVCYVIATHMHPDHLLGHRAFADDHPEFIAADTQTRALMVRQAGYLARQKEVLGAVSEGTDVVLPTRTVKGELTLDLGGRTLLLKTWRTAHTDNDLTVKDSATQVFFTGDLLFCQHIPVIDGSLRGWLKILSSLKAEAAGGTVVPGHGPVQRDLTGFEAEERYLSQVADEVRTQLKKRATLSTTVSESVLPTDWQLSELYHRRNVTAAYAELEWED